MRAIQAISAFTFGLMASFISMTQSARGEDFTPTRFSVEVRGQGPDVILIPGLGSSREVWNAEASRLEATHRLHLVQFAGFAGEPAGAAADGAVLMPFVEDLHAYIRAEGLQRPAIIGHSMGGLAGLTLARVAPQSVGRLMIVDSHPFYSALFDPNATAESAAGPAGAMAQQVVAMSTADFARMQRFGVSRLVTGEAGRDLVADWSIASDRAVFAQAMYEVMTSDMRGEIGAIAAPLTVLYSHNADMGAPAQVDALFQSAYAPAPNKTLIRIDESRHFIMLDQPEAFHAAVLQFLR